MKLASLLSRPATRFVQVVLLSIVVIFCMGVTDPEARFNNLGHKMMCTCSCNQILLECNHVGCPSSEGMRQELMAAIVGTGGAGGSNDSMVLQAFVQKYGPTVLAAPTATGFNRVAWIMPFAVLLLGMLGTVLLVRKWRLRTVDMPAVPNTPAFEKARDRIRDATDEFQGDPRP